MTTANKPGLQALATGGVVRHRLALFDNFLDGNEVASLAAQVFAAEADFVPSTVTDSKDSYRKSLVLNPPAQLTRRVVEKIRALMPEVMARLKMTPFSVAQIECQVTANNDGSFFRIHTDAGVNNTVKRQFTFVYYFNRQPKAFEGGELRVYDDVIRNGKLARTDSFQVVEPRHNSIVFFQAAIMHEVTQVSVPSREFRDSRFTLNGWVHRA